VVVDCEAWSKRDLSGENYGYVWADGIHAKVRLEDDANKKQYA
jgi:putative transposase